MDPVTESCVILLLLRLYLPQPLAVAPLLPLFSEVVCAWTLKLHALHQYWLGLQSFDEGACLLLTWYFACGRHLYMWKCSVLMQSQACPWVFCMLDFYDGVKKTVNHAPDRHWNAARRWVRVNPDDVGVCVATVWASAAICVSGMCGNGTLRMCWCQRVLHSCLDGAFALKKSLQGSGLLWLQHCAGRLQVYC